MTFPLKTRKPEANKSEDSRQKCESGQLTSKCETSQENCEDCLQREETELARTINHGNNYRIKKLMLEL